MRRLALVLFVVAVAAAWWLRGLPVSLAQGPERQQLPANTLEGGIAWINTRSPIHLEDLRGKVVVLDFWTYCCINCHHILPTLAKLEQKYPNQVVVIGVHTAKFEAEKDTDNIRKKVAEYGIKHPVVNDAEQAIWNRLGVSSWPTLIVIDPLGRAVAGAAGEVGFEALDRVVGRVVAEARKAGNLNETPLKFEPEDEKSHDAPLRYPGKVLADAAGKRLFIADTANNRIVVTDLDGKHLATIGNGIPALKDGSYDAAGFNRPQGICLVGSTLLVADTENHAIREVDLEDQTVTTIAGTGEQAPFRVTGGPAKSSPLSSPWDVLPDPSNPDRIYIAMAGLHQLWTLDRAQGEVKVWAGSGLENITDGKRAAAAFAQPSGLATDGQWLYVADSEVSGIRAVALKGDRVETIVGVHLFGFGDKDGVGNKVRLQHCLGLAHGDGKLYVADTYNNKVKVCDPKPKSVRTFVGSGEPGLRDDPAQFDEPGGLSLAGTTLYVADTNNHAIRAIDTKTKAVRTLKLDGVAAPKPPRRPPTFPNAVALSAPAAKVQPGESFGLDVSLALPEGYKINPDAPMPYLVETPGRTDVLGPGAPPSGGRVGPPATSFRVEVPLAQPAKAGETLEVKLSVSAFLCRESLCEIHSYVWTVPVTFAEGGGEAVALSNAGESPGGGR
jgi:thiol-disulfide isomerase/thioredoxin